MREGIERKDMERLRCFDVHILYHCCVNFSLCKITVQCFLLIYFPLTLSTFCCTFVSSEKINTLLSFLLK